MADLSPLEYAQRRLADAEREGKFFVRMSGVLEEMAAKWEELSGEQFDREVEALKCADQADACRAEWKRWKAKINTLMAQPMSEAA